MRTTVLSLLFLVFSATLRAATAPEPSKVENPSIDMKGYLHVANEAALHRESHRIAEEEFIRLSNEPGTIILDARSGEKYDQLHIKGAVNLSFPDIAIETLRQALPDRNARILIYCNNNFRNAEEAFPSKIARASLNLSTYISLYSYGYRNVWELAPLIDIEESKLAFEGTELERKTDATIKRQ